MTSPQRLYIGLAVAITIMFSILFQLTAEWIPTLVIGFGAMTIGGIAWIRTSLRHPTDPKKLLPPYALTAALLMFHIGEEYAFGFGDRIAHISGGLWSTRSFVWQLALIFPVVWIIGAVAVALRNPLGGFTSWFLFMGMLIGEPTHLLLFPLREAYLFGGGYDYFPGVWTALLPLVASVWGMWVVVTDARRQRSATGGASPKTTQPTAAASSRA